MYVCLYVSGLHKTSFITFLFSSVAYMLGTIWLHTSLYSHTAQAKVCFPLLSSDQLIIYFQDYKTHASL